MNLLIKHFVSVTVLSAIVMLVSCSQANSSSTVLQAAAIESSEQCHLCGMLIMPFPGPKGELASKNEDSVFKFCSTKDLFTFYLQPENQHRTQALYVHDMSKSPWESPDDEHFMDAKDAFYVLGSSMKGAMGSTLGSFSNLADAKAFAEQYGGKVLSFDDITLAALSQPMIMKHE